MTTTSLFCRRSIVAQVQSLFTPNVRYIEVIEDGFAGGNVIPADFTPTPPNFAKVRENIVKSGKLWPSSSRTISAASRSSAPSCLRSIRAPARPKIDYARVRRGARVHPIVVASRARTNGGMVEVHIVGFAEGDRRHRRRRPWGAVSVRRLHRRHRPARLALRGPVETRLRSGRLLARCRDRGSSVGSQRSGMGLIPTFPSSFRSSCLPSV